MPKRVLYLIPRFTTGGAEKLVFDYAGYFQKQGWGVAVASTVGGGELIEDFEKLGVEVIAGERKSLLNLWRNWRRISEWVRVKKPDIIHTHVFSADVIGYLLKKKFKDIKWISTQHNVACEHSLARRLVLRWILKRADKVIVVSEAVKNFCLVNLRIKPEKVRLIKNGLELEKWLAVPSGNLFTGEKLRLATIGRIEKQKGHRFLFEALAKLSRHSGIPLAAGKAVPWQLDIFGVGSLKDELKNLAVKLNIADKMIWQGVNTNLVQEMKNIDLVVQPSLWEGMSLVVMEAMAAGRLVITTPAGGAELIENGRNGVIVPASDALALAEAIKFVWQNREKAKQMALTGREWARERFGIEKNIIELNKIYHCHCEERSDEAIQK